MNHFYLSKYAHDKEKQETSADFIMFHAIIIIISSYTSFHI